MQKYEGMLILEPRLSEERRLEIGKKIEELIVQENGKMKNFQIWGQRRLAYEINKLKEGFYYLFHFSAEAQAVNKLKKTCRSEEDILRLFVMKMK
ncbi:MAG: 30S ribosomal protein S6 [Candidatus Omnitrophica bacterium]|nr:30S ribosomal protein S6 [Candidatus Omnitrophota bacterium]